MRNPSTVNDVKTYLLFSKLFFKKSKGCIKIRVADSKKDLPVFNLSYTKIPFLSVQVQ